MSDTFHLNPLLKHYVSHLFYWSTDGIHSQDDISLVYDNNGYEYQKKFIKMGKQYTD